jgi:hypothetical protein
MANGYQPGEYFERFLSQLPQMYQMQQSMKMQEERLNLQKQTAQESQAYREEILKRNQSEMDMKQFRDDTTALSNSPDALKAYLEQSKLMKDNPKILAAFNEDEEQKETLNREANRLWGLSPENMVFESRKFLNRHGITNAQAKLARESLNEGIDRLTMTNEEFATTESYLEYAMLFDKLSNPDKYFIAGTPTAQREGMMQAWGDRMAALRVAGKAELQKGFGLYPDTNVSDDDIKKILRDFTEIDTEEGIARSKTMGPLFAETDVDTSEQDSSIQTAGFTLPAIVDSGGTWSKDAVFLEDDAGMNRLITEYNKTGEATLGPLEKAAREGSVMMPVPRETFKAVDAGVNVLNRANNMLSGLTRPAVLFDTHSKAGKKAGKPADWDKKYKEQAEDFKKALKDMYNLYLRLDPSSKGNTQMRNKIAEAIIVYKNILKKQGKWEKSYQYDPEIAAILEQIQL